MKRHPLVRPALRMITIVLVLYASVVLLMAIFQRRFIYYPARLDVESSGKIAEREGFESWTNRAGEIIGWKLSTSGDSTGSVLIVHGNGGSALNRGYLARPIAAADNADVFILEYPGYGFRKGSPSEKALVNAAEEAFDTLPTDQPVYVVGESLGTGVAAHLAQSRRVAGLLLITPYDELVALGATAMPWLPVRWIMRDRFHPAQALAKYRGPAVFSLAGADRVIPEKFGQRLFDQFEGPKKLHRFPEAGHNDVAEQSEEWWADTFAFWREHALPSQTAP